MWIFLNWKIRVLFFFVYIAWQNTEKKNREFYVVCIANFKEAKDIKFCISDIDTFLKTPNVKSFVIVHSFVSDSLRPHGLQHPRLPCPSPSPGVCSDSRPSSWWCHPKISSSVKSFISLIIHQRWLQFAHSVQKTLSGTELLGSWVLAQGGSYILLGCYFFPLQLSPPCVLLQGRCDLVCQHQPICGGCLACFRLPAGSFSVCSGTNYILFHIRYYIYFHIRFCKLFSIVPGGI